MRRNTLPRRALFLKHGNTVTEDAFGLYRRVLNLQR